MSSDTQNQSGAPPPYHGGKVAPEPYPQAGPAPYPPAQQPYPQPYPQMINNTTVVAMQQPQPVTNTTVVVGGGGSCPNCRVGNLVEQFSCSGIIVAIIFFPLGVLCCFYMRHRVCSNCHASF